MEKNSREPLPKQIRTRAVLVGAIGGLALIALPYFITISIKLASHGKIIPSELLQPVYNLSLLFILPFMQGLFTGVIAGKFRAGLLTYCGMGLLILAFDFALGIVILREGSICLLMAFPVFLAVILLGLGAGRFFARYKNIKTLNSTLIPLVLLSVVYDTYNPAPYLSNAISDAVTVNAPPEKIWPYIVQYPENTKAPEYWLWKIGLPAPTQSTASGSFVGADRQCRFTNNVVFNEQITEIIPNKLLTFKITSQPNDPEILGHFSLDKGQLYLEANPDGTTTIIATSWYRIFAKPSTYFDWWATDIVRNVHFRVLNHMKELAELDNHPRVAMLQ